LGRGKTKNSNHEQRKAIEKDPMRGERKVETKKKRKIEKRKMEIPVYQGAQGEKESGQGLRQREIEIHERRENKTERGTRVEEGNLLGTLRSRGYRKLQRAKQKRGWLEFRRQSKKK